MLDCASPYRTDLAPVTFWLFPNLQSDLKGKRSQDVEEITKSVIVTLKVIPNDEFIYLHECAHTCAGRMAADSHPRSTTLLLRIIVDEHMRSCFEKRILHNRYFFTLRF